MRFFFPALGILAVIAAFTGPSASPARAHHEPGTFSVVAYDSTTGEFGVAVQSKAFSVGPAVAWAEAGVGAVATQAMTNRSFGPVCLQLLREGWSAEEVVEELLAEDEGRDSRQLAVIDDRGRTAAYTGSSCLNWAGSVAGPGFSCQGNILAGEEVAQAMARAMRVAPGELADRLLAALDAGQAAGGDRRGQQSAAILIVRPSTSHPEYNHRYLDLRVEDSPEPLVELRRIYQMAQGDQLAEAHLIFADEYEAGGATDLARRERDQVGRILREALKRGSRDANLLNSLAWSTATHDIFLEEAEQAARRAVEVDPKSVEILDTLAEVCFRRGKVAEAIQIEERALAMDPESKYLGEQLERFRGKR